MARRMFPAYAESGTCNYAHLANMAEAFGIVRNAVLCRVRHNRHTYRTWLDSFGAPIGVQQKLIRHSGIGTTVNIYGDAMTEDMAEAHAKVVGMALASSATQRDTNSAN